MSKVTRSQAVNQAVKWIGSKESDGSHRKIIDVYNSRTPLPRGYKVKYIDDWCAIFASAVIVAIDATENMRFRECSCPKMVQHFKDAGRWIESDSYVPEKGDYIFYDWDDTGKGDDIGSPDHVGIVEKVSDNMITVIEGNKKDAVERRTLTVNGRYIRGYGLPYYAAEPKKSSTSKSTKTNTASAGSKKTRNDLVNYIKVAQKAMNDFVGLSIAVDGIIGSETRKAFAKTLQTALNKDYNAKLVVDGSIGSKTLNALGNHYVKQGETQFLVTAMEIGLMLLGYYKSSIEVAGHFGSGMFEAVKAFQAANGLQADGICGYNTIRRILKNVGVL